MGCKSCRSEALSDYNLTKRIMDYIERDDTSNLQRLIQLLGFELTSPVPELLNSRIIPYNNFPINFLGYSILKCRYSCYLYLIHNLKSSLQVTEEILRKQNISPLYHLCQEGCTDILKHYIPHYLSSISTRSYSNSTHYNSLEISEVLTPIQIAVKLGHLNVVHLINETNQKLPESLDVNYANESSGENCAVIAVRSVNFVMIKYLFEHTKADFHIKNKFNEGVLQVLAASRGENAVKFQECLMYLVEVAKVDVSYMYERTLIALRGLVASEYIIEKLKRLGIVPCLTKIEGEFSWKKGKSCEDEWGVNVGESELSEINCQSYGDNFIGSMTVGSTSKSRLF